MSRLIITKIRNLKRRKTHVWTGSTPLKKSVPSYQAQLEYRPHLRRFEGLCRERPSRAQGWSHWRDLNQEQTAYLRSLLAPEDIAACFAASLTRNARS